MENKAKEVSIVAVTDVKPNSRNNNIHSREQIERIKKNIRELGFRNPLVVSNQSGLLIAGHARLAAAIEVGMETVPVIFQDFESEEQEYQHMTADNALADWANIDLAQVNKDIQELGPFDIELLGLKSFVVEPMELKEEPLKIKDIFKLEVDCSDYDQCESLYKDLESRGFKVKIISI